MLQLNSLKLELMMDPAIGLPDTVGILLMARSKATFAFRCITFSFL